MQKTFNGFNLRWVLVIVALTSVVSALTTGIIIFNNGKITNKISANLQNDEELNQFLEVYANIISEYYEDINREELISKAISAMLNYLGDDYTTYMNDEETNELFDQLSGEYTGIGVSINNEDKSILQVFKDSPANKVGILVGDIIVGYNNQDVTNLTANEVVEMIKSNDDYFTLKLLRGEEIVSVSLRNEKIINPSIEYEILENTSIGYIYISAFSSNLDKQMKDALEELESNGITSLIVDVRDDTGGYLDAATNVSSLFLKKGKRIFSLDYKDELTHYKDETEEHREYEIVVLTNSNSASASEVLAAALRESYGAKIVGETTFGKGKVQHTQKLDSGGMVKYTSAYWLTPNGTCVDEVGLIPDYPVSNEYIKDENGNVTQVIDKQLEKAMSLLNGM